MAPEEIRRSDASEQAKLRSRLAEIRREIRQTREDPGQAPFLVAAAVLSRFVPESLAPFNDTGQEASPGWADFVLYSEPVTRYGGSWWRLRVQARREALRQLRTRERMRAALATNADRPDDPIQRMLTAVLTLDPNDLDVDKLDRDDLAALIMVRDWFSGILEDLPSETSLRRAAAVGDLLAPMRRLAGRSSFVGRTSQLKRLRDYVNLEESLSRGSLVLTGVGGSGKSTLLARFILEQAENQRRETGLSFVYLDLDVPAIVPTQPLSLVGEAARQLSVQWPEYSVSLGSIAEEVGKLVLSEEASSALEGTRLLPTREAVFNNFCQLLQEGSGGRSLFFVIDTFEEVQYLGQELVRNIFSLLESLQKAAPRLRIVVSGRNILETVGGFSLAKPIELGDLRPEEARLLVGGELARLEGMKTAVDERVVDEIVDIVGRNPMSLKLACMIVREQGIEPLRSVETRNWLLLRIKTETMQARLYGRILGHIHDPNVRRIAHPGLIVRRITPAVILEVLREPCGLEIKALPDAEELMVELQRESALLETDSDGSLRHRADVRRVMLPDLAEQVPSETVKKIHDLAVDYYREQPGPVARAEEIYHRLMRGDKPESLEKRWMRGVGRYLRGAVEEFSPEARLWVSKMSGATPREDLLKSADQERWEEITSRSAQRLLQSGDPKAALDVMRKRRERLDTSALFRLESEALRLLGRPEEALSIARRGMERARRADAAVVQCELSLQAATVEEILGDFGAALGDLKVAEAAQSEEPDLPEKLRPLVAQIRILRKLGESHNQERRETLERVVALLNADVREALERRPALLREVVAELGAVRPEILEWGLGALGLELRAEKQFEILAQALAAWDKRLASSKRRSGELADRAGVPAGARVDQWEQLLVGLSWRDLARRILHWRRELPPDRELDKALTRLYRFSVDASLGIAEREDALASLSTEERLRQEWHPPGDLANRGILTPCFFVVDASFEKLGVERWEEWGDVLVRLHAAPNDDQVYLVPSRHVEAVLRDPERLRVRDVLTRKKRMTLDFIRQYGNRDLTGFWFYKTIAKDGRRRVHVYSKDYDEFLNLAAIEERMQQGARVRRAKYRSRRELERYPLARAGREDLQKGRWGGRSNADGRLLSAEVIKGAQRQYDVALQVSPTDGSILKGVVKFHLPPSFPESPVSIRRYGAVAILDGLQGEQAFTVGVEVFRQDGTRTVLELDLATEFERADQAFDARPR